MKKKAFLTPVFLLVLLMGFNTSTITAQGRRIAFENLTHYDHKPYHFGFSLGVNRMGFALKPIESLNHLGGEREPFDTLFTVQPQSQNGFHIGIVSNLKLLPQLDLRFVPTLSFGDRTVIFEGSKDSRDVRRTQEIESTFIDFPLHFKYKSVRMLNTRLYVIGGLKYSLDLASAEDRDEGEDEILVRIARNDFFYELGVGFDHYFYYFKFSTEIKASFGLRNLIRPEDTIYTDPIDKLNSKILMVSFLFE